jgi:hypothetical protein
VPAVNDVLDAVADAAHIAAGRSGLQSFWTGIATRALDMATRDVGGVLASQGLTGGQIASWAGYNAAVLGQALFWALAQGGSLLPTPVNQDDVRQLDLREWLKSATLTDLSGNLIKPDPLASVAGKGVIRGGFQDAANRDPTRRAGFVDSGTGTFRAW